MAKATILPPLRNARGAASSNDVEVDTLYTELADAERAHRAEQFWKRFGVTALAASLIVVVGTAGFVYYQRHTEQVLSVATTEMSRADELLKNGKAVEAAALFGKASEDAGKLAPLLRMRQAEALVLANKHADALPILRELAHSKNLDPALRDTARMSLARQTTDPEEMRRELAAAAEPGAPFAPLAQQMRAALAMADNKPEEALAAVNAVDAKDKDLPASLVSRNEELRMVFTPNQAVNNANASMGQEVSPTEEEKREGAFRESIRSEVDKQLPASAAAAKEALEKNEEDAE